MKGFTGKYYKDIPVFIREDYEEAHKNESEAYRLAQYFGMNCESLTLIMSTAEARDPRTLYNTGDERLDLKLEQGYSSYELWVPYERGYVHRVTGEYVIGYHPDRESWPAWEFMPRTGRVSESTIVEELGVFAVGLAKILNLI